ncbi:MAG: DUF1552 domain-containing protein [Verrucomicrobiales bacterium]|nr:DUF1552 domain-containing protein [Verrucomicrobiales bacterium]
MPTRPLSRRHVLRGLGVSIALPMLDCMRPLRAAKSGGPAPKRAVFIYLPNGVNTLDYQILESGKDYRFSKSLAPLEKHRARITPISGLHHPHGLGHHHNCQSIWLTGAEIGQGKRNSVSLDQLIAEKTAPHTRFASLELSDTGRSLAYNRDGISLPAETKPSEVFKRLFEVPAGGIEKEREALRRRGSVLDAVLDEARSLEGKLGNEDKGRLDQYLTAVREVEIRTERADGWLGVPRPEVSEADRRKVTREVSQNNQPGDYFRAVYDLIVLAFQTDLTRVVTFSTGDEGKGLPVPELGINQTRHALSHHNGDPDQLARLTRSDAFNFEQFAYFLDRLAAIEDQEGSLLDTTLSLFGSGMAYGHSHGNANLPLVVAGGEKLGLRHGSHLDFNTGHFDGYALDETGNLKTSHYQLCSRPANSDARMSNLLLTLGQRLDVETEQFGDSLKPLSEIVS